MPKRSSSLQPVQPRTAICLEIEDNTRVSRSAVQLFNTKGSSDPPGQAARLADQFIRRNLQTFEMLQVQVDRDYNGSDVLLHMAARNIVGAVPLISPTTGRPDLGLVVRPRFPWAGIGPMLAEMGWLIAPTPLKLPLLRRSERRVPPWVMSFMVLTRLKALLDSISLRFEAATEVRSMPKGRIGWTQYATREIPRGAFLALPCTFPDLREDRLLMGAIRFAIEKQLGSLWTQSHQGTFVHKLISFADAIAHRVSGVPARRPAGSELTAWARRPLRNDDYTNGLQALEWAIEDRGLAGAGELDGIPWSMPMEQFFEAWVETILRQVARQLGGSFRTGRRSETVARLSWEPPYQGSQRSLIPDLILETERLALVVDAKYKRHWEEMQERAWQAQTDEIREQHRVDLMQVLAYANLVRSREIVCCLVYPCSQETWESLASRRRLFYRAELSRDGRRVRVLLTGFPMSAAKEMIAATFIEELRRLDP